MKLTSGYQTTYGESLSRPVTEENAFQVAPGGFIALVICYKKMNHALHISQRFSKSIKIPVGAEPAGLFKNSVLILMLVLPFSSLPSEISTH